MNAIVGEYKAKPGGIRMYSGRIVDPLDLQPNDIDPIDICHQLSWIYRYCGAIKITVAEHSVLLAQYFLRNGNGPCAKAALLHDASEIYLGADMPRPVKRRLPMVEEIEIDIQKRIFAKFGVPWKHMLEIQRQDKMISCTEMLDAWGEKLGDVLHGVELRYWTPDEAQDEFSFMFDLLFGTKVRSERLIERRARAVALGNLARLDAGLI